MKCYKPKKRKVKTGQIQLPDDCTMTAEQLTEGTRLRFMNSLIPILEAASKIDLYIDGSPMDRKDLRAVQKLEQCVFEEFNRFLGTTQSEMMFKDMRPFAITPRDGYFVQIIVDNLSVLLSTKK